MSEEFYLDLMDDTINDTSFERQFVNVLSRTTDIYHSSLFDTYGEDRLFDNGYRRRTKHEVYSGIKKCEHIGVIINAEIVNLPYTVINERGKPAETAFTVRNPELHRNIYLVPDHTPTRILKDKAYHNAGLEALFKDQKITRDCLDSWIGAMSDLNVGERVAASIIHEYGHILTYRAMDNEDIETAIQMYDWLGDMGYLDNCSHRIVQFSKDPLWQMNVAVEQLAEDFRVSQYVKKEQDVCPLPSCLSYRQDIANPEKYLEGVEIMTKLLNIQEQIRKKQQKTSLDNILPFGEANRSDSVMNHFSLGEITPLTEDDKKKAREELTKMFE
ncbi:hypothetical protein [Paenibacillus medicaginis]|uniref:Uncharacterized protein n=1 Tax=Paenibacillus medicaginis TaxID=1470560 RepID=A0ABV5BY61_9BACL